VPAAARYLEKALMSDGSEKRYETSELPVRPFLWFAIGFALALLAIIIGVALYTKELAKPGAVFGRVEHPPEKSLAEFPRPQLQADPPKELRDYLATKARELSTYGWIDQQSRIVRIPIDRAIDLTVSRGLPVRIPDSGLTELDMQAQKAGVPKLLPPSSAKGRNP
jgi:hypothetical protein